MLQSAADAEDGPYGQYDTSSISLAPSESAVAFLAYSRASGSCGAGAYLSASAPGASRFESQTGVSVLHACGSTLLVSPVVPAGTKVYSTYPATAQPSPAVSTAPSCTSAAIALSSGQTVQTTTFDDLELELTNTSSSACSLNDRWPLGKIYGSSGALITTPRWTAAMPSFITTLGGSATPPVSQTLAAGGTAVFFLEVPASTGAAACGVASDATFSLHDTGDQFAISIAGSDLTACPPSGLTTSFISPISLATSPNAPVSGGGVTPDSDGSGYYYGTDSGSTPCSGTNISYNGLSGKCGFYGGQVGAYWLDISGCPSSGWGWNSGQATDPDDAYGDPSGGAGTSAVFFLGGPGIDPSQTYSGGTPTGGQISEAEYWGEEQADTAYNQLSSSPYVDDVYQSTLFMDIEVDEGWDGAYSTSSGGGTCESPYQENTTYSTTLNNDELCSFEGTLYNDTGWELAVYSAPTDWNDWTSSASVGSMYEWTFVNEATSEASGSNSPKSYSWSEADPQWFGGVSSSSSQATAWQWATPVDTPSQSEDLDQIKRSNFPDE